MKKNAFVYLLFVILSTVGCQQVSKKKDQYMAHLAKDYHASRLIAPLKVPEDLHYPTSSDSYPLPEHVSSQAAAAVSLVPPGFGELSEENK